MPCDEQEREMKMLMDKLAKIEKELKSEITALEGQTGRKVTVEGKPFDVYVRQQWDDYRTQKELEEQHREVQRKNQTQQAMMYGSQPASVVKKRVAAALLMSPHSTVHNSKASGADVGRAAPPAASVHRTGAPSTAQKRRAAENASVSRLVE